MAPKILIVLSSYNFVESANRKAGFYLPELAHPYEVFSKAGIEMTVVSVKGGEAPLDPDSITRFKDDKLAINFYKQHKEVWNNTAKLSEYLGRADEFDALYFPGGHAPAFDLAFDKDSHALIVEFVTKGKVVSAVCHGVAALTEVVLPDGSFLLAGKKAAGYTNEEEVQAQMTEHVPFLIEDRLNEITSHYTKAAEPWWPNVAIDGKIITGQNPASATPLAEAVVNAIGN
ncbi:ThiJ/PfpI family protein [Trichoderma velutinum]